MLKASEQAFLQEVQDLLADFVGMPICLFLWDEVKKRVESKEDQKFSIFNKELMVTYYWSYNPTFFRLLERELRLAADLNGVFADNIRQCIKSMEDGDRQARVFKNDLDHWCFVAPVTVFKEEGLRERKPVFILCGGPVHITETPHAWEAYKMELDHLKDKSIHDESFQIQLACEFLELPTRPSEKILREEARNIQYTYNGVVRDLLQFTGSDDYPFTGDLETVLYELLRHVRNSDQYL